MGKGGVLRETQCYIFGLYLLCNTCTTKQRRDESVLRQPGKSQIHNVALSTGFGIGMVIKIVLRVRRTSGCTTVEILYSYVIWHILNT